MRVIDKAGQTVQVVVETDDGAVVVQWVYTGDNRIPTLQVGVLLFDRRKCLCIAAEQPNSTINNEKYKLLIHNSGTLKFRCKITKKYLINTKKYH
jgi:hypothetical protein